MASQLKLPLRSLPRFPDLDDVAHLRVTESNPPSSDANGLDYERCSALHNAIIRHGWRASGHDMADLPLTPWWETAHNLPHLAGAQQRLHISVVEFLKRAIDTSPFPDESNQNNFFFYCPALARPDQSEDYEHSDKGDIVTLYYAGDFKSKCNDRIVYNQDTHTCLFNEYDSIDLLFNEQPLPWQPLESVLSVYLDMIERGKAVALHKSVQTPPGIWEPVPQDDSALVRTEWRLREPQILRDPASGAARLGPHVFNPWVIVPYTSKDLSETLDAWDVFVQATEDRMPSIAPGGPGCREGFYTEQTLMDSRIRIDGFAWKFFRTARKPRCIYLGPGLRLPTASELISSRTSDIQDASNPINPISVLRGDDMAQPPWFGLDRVPWGLYLDSSDPEGSSPFEDGARLVLPYSLGEHGYAKKGDGSPADGNANLYQIGWNPFIVGHSTQLLAIIGHFGSYVETAADRDVRDYNTLCRFVDTCSHLEEGRTYQYLVQLRGPQQAPIHIKVWRKAVHYAYERFIPVNAEVNALHARLCQLLGELPMEAMCIPFNEDGRAAQIPILQVDDAMWVHGALRDVLALHKRLVDLVRGGSVKSAMRNLVSAEVQGRENEAETDEAKLVEEDLSRSKAGMALEQAYLTDDSTGTICSKAAALH
ncbi:hypothetical protein LTR85_006513 [Meristemomyces frigidus]|nr:hypothetical protein LTR85_006513 [Meristemomyces frigidus]